MNKEELRKIYSTYLPYGLEVQLPADDSFPNKITKLSGIMNFGLLYLGSGGRFGFTQRDVDKVKPVLYDLSYLTKEIEHEGERFIPIVEILKKTSLLDLSECKFDVWQDEEKFITMVYVNAENKNGRVIDSMYYDSNLFWHMNNDGSFNPTNPQREPQELLLKFHFNTFEIPEGDFINKATLNK